MRILIICFSLISIQIFSQSYLNIHFTDETYKHSLISSLDKMTFNSAGDQINFHLTDESIFTENIADISKMTLDDSALGEPLPVELSSFSALVNGSSVILNWRTETEVSNYGFEVQRSVSGIPNSEWWKIGFVEGYGNSNSPKEYSFQDDNPPSGKVQYRLKQIDTDGKFEYSYIVSIEIGIPSKFELKQNFPNPFNPATNIVYGLPADGFVTIKVYDIIGNEVYVLVNENKKAGSYVVTFNGSNLSSGVYFCRINSGNYSGSIKMMLIK